MWQNCICCGFCFLPCFTEETPMLYVHNGSVNGPIDFMKVGIPAILDYAATVILTAQYALCLYCPST